VAGTTSSRGCMMLVRSHGVLNVPCLACMNYALEESLLLAVLLIQAVLLGGIDEPQTSVEAVRAG
jgi:hypothetical protein